MKSMVNEGPWPWLWHRPLLIVILAYFSFSLGIWNCQQGGAEDSVPVGQALSSTENKIYSASTYVNTFMFILNVMTPDPVNAVTVMRIVTSAMCSVGLYLLLCCFSQYLSRASILFATFVWISSSANAPNVQSTCLSSFSFGLMLFAIYFLIRLRNLTGLICFYMLGLTAAGDRPEYMAPAGLITVGLAAIVVWKAARFLEDVLDFTRLNARVFCAVGVLLLAIIGGVVERGAIYDKAVFCNNYLLFGFGQCYADFYHREHPHEAFTPMTEYVWLLKRDFGDPHTFLQIIYNNPKESFRYFVHNTFNNLSKIPKGLLNVRDREASGKSLYHCVHILCYAGLILSLHFIWCGPRELGRMMLKHSVLWSNILILLLLCSASSVAIILLIGTVRYWITIVPILYLFVAYSFQKVITVFSLEKYQSFILTLACIAYCSPHFIIPQPANEYRTLQHIAPLVKKNPVIVAWWAGPDCVYGFNGHAQEVNTTDGVDINQKDVESGRYDIIMIDGNFRSTQIWQSHHAFFEDLEAHPGIYGYSEVTDVPTGSFHILYRAKE